MLNEILEAIQVLIDENNKKLNFDKTYRGIVQSVNGAKATVKINEENFECNIKNGAKLSVGDIVLVISPNNNFNEKYIDGKLGLTQDDIYTNGTAIDHNHDNVYYTKTEIDKQHKKLKALSLIL